MSKYWNKKNLRVYPGGKEVQGIYLGSNVIYDKSSIKEVVLIDDDFTTASNADLINEGWLSVGDAYGMDTSTNGLHFHTFETDTATGIEFQVNDSLVGKKLSFELEGYAGRFNRWGNIGFSLDRPANYSNKKKKYDVVASCAGWGMGLWSLPGYNSAQYANIHNLSMGYRNGTTAQNLDMWGDKGNKGLYWIKYNDNYYLDLPFTNGTYKGKGYVDFKNWFTYSERETPNGTIKTFERDFSSDSQELKDSLNTFLSGTDKYIRLTNSRGYGSSSYDNCYWRKVKVWYE